MAADQVAKDRIEAEEIQAIVREIRERVQKRYPQYSADGKPINIPLADLMPVVHARDAAEGKVAAIGSVNPRPGGPINWIIQTWKNFVARVLDWHIRGQIDFNRNIVECVHASIESMNELNRSLVEIGYKLGELHKLVADTQHQSREYAQQVEDVRAHWVEWRADWERKVAVNEIQFLRSVADLQAGFQHRTLTLESNYRDLAHAQHTEFTATMERNAQTIQKQMWADFEKIRLEFEALIFTELRSIRQRAVASQPSTTAAAPSPISHLPSPTFDYSRFADRFRGTEEYVRERQRFYIPYFQGRTAVLDIGCGRGEFLELMREAGVAARGIDLDQESVALCRSKGLEAEVADLYAYLDALPPGSLDGVFSSQVVEHLPPERLPEMIKLCAAKLRKGGVLALETPNPECLAIFATHFYLDPTHTRPIPHPLLAFYMEEFGLGQIEVHKISPAIESMPALAELPESFRNAFFGGLDYAIIGRKLV